MQRLQLRCIWIFFLWGGHLICDKTDAVVSDNSLDQQCDCVGEALVSDELNASRYLVYGDQYDQNRTCVAYRRGNNDASQHGCCQTALRQTIPDSFHFIFEIDLRREFMITKLLMRGYPNRTTIIMSRVAITGVSEDGATTVCLQTVDPHNYIAQHYLDEFTEYLECSQPMKARYINIDAGSTWDIYHPCQADIYGYEYKSCPTAECIEQCGSDMMCKPDAEAEVFRIKISIFIGIAIGVIVVSGLLFLVITCSVLYIVHNKLKIPPPMKPSAEESSFHGNSSLQEGSRGATSDQELSNSITAHVSQDDSRAREGYDDERVSLPQMPTSQTSSDRIYENEIETPINMHVSEYINMVTQNIRQ